MSKDKGERIFNKIAPIYDWFYKKQINNYVGIIKQIENKFKLSKYKSLIDIGCGTGAFCAVAKNLGLDVVGVDIAAQMVDIAKRKKETKGVEFYHLNALEGLPFDDNSFDIAFASYVAHGLQKNRRKKLYIEMKRLAKEYVVFHDFNQNKSLLVSLIEWLEGGDYFKFIKIAKEEMEECMHQMQECFIDVKVIKVGKRSSWYICKTNNSS